jgi:hypothetical protein
LIEAQTAQIDAQIAVTAALVEHQEARLQLMLNIGALRTDFPQFWLQDHLASLSLAGPATATPSPDSEQPVIPPDQLFEN